MSPEGGGAERRVQPRYQFKVPGTAWGITRAAVGPFPVTSSNISLTGIMLHTSSDDITALVPGDRILLGFNLPQSREQVKVTVAVVWKRQGVVSLLGRWSFGAYFVDTPEAEIRKLFDPAAAAGKPLPAV
jgi:hypothetical protein